MSEDEESIEEAVIDAEKVLVVVCDTAKDIEDRINALRTIDRNGFLRDSNVPASATLKVWESGLVNEDWKLETLKGMMESQFYGVMLVPMEYDRMSACAAAGLIPGYETKGPIVRKDILGLIRTGEFQSLEALVQKESIAPTTEYWGPILLSLLLTGDYDWASSDGNRYLRKAVAWIENQAPGTVAAACDKFGNNALAYLHCAMTESNPHYTSRTPDGIWMADNDAAFLIEHGCDADCENVFGISYKMLREEGPVT